MTLPPETSETILNALASILATGSALFGALVSRWLARQRRQDRDLACAREKIRGLYLHLGLVLPEQLETLDDVFAAIRAIQLHLGVKAAPTTVGLSPIVSQQPGEKP